MFYLLDKLVRGKPLQLCKRCGLKYGHSSKECPHCSHISDHQLAQLLKRRAGVRLELGRIMWIGAIVLVVLLIVINTGL